MIKKLNHHLAERGLTGTVKRFNKCLQENGMKYTIRQIFSLHSTAPHQDSTIYKSNPPSAKLKEREASDSYLSNANAQYEYLKNYKKNQTKQRIANLLSLLKAEKHTKGVILYPVSYDINVKQRPEHILRVLADEGYLCLMLKIGANHQSTHLNKMGERLYYTDLFEEAITYFSEKPVYLYTTTPFFYYLTTMFKKAYVIYDVLDDLKIFANYCKPMEIDHKELLSRADSIIYSSRVMKDKFDKFNTASILIENGVWPEDFDAGSEERPRKYDINLRKINSVKVGYHGVISEFLNFDIIESILENAGADLYLIGPVAAFSPDKEFELRERVSQLKQYRNFHLLGFVPYPDLVHYIKQFDYCIIPFELNYATDAVSPLKLFESIACEKPVLATATKTLLAYRDVINILKDSEFSNFIAHRKGLKVNVETYQKILLKNSWPNLLKPLLAFIESDTERIGETPRVKSKVPRVDIININFFDWKGEVLYKGGAERYVYDLAKLCQEYGFQTRIMQNANSYFSKEFDGIPVIGVPSKFENYIPKLSDCYNSYISETDLIITSPLELASELNPEQNIIGINHGIWWDDKFNDLGGYTFERYKNIFAALKTSNSCVCVDTNFINWVRTYDWTLAQKCEYVPNYVDQNQFKSQPKKFDEDLIILYPRRLYEARGLYITIEAFKYLFRRYPWLKLHLVGQADENDTLYTKRFIAKFPKNVEWYELDMAEMHKAYEKSHIVLVPTMYAEGTSLSCIEAMATNNGIIATTIGGLPNLINHRYNGLLIKPSADEIIKSVEFLINNRDILKTFAKNAIESSSSLNKRYWLESWSSIIEQNVSFKPAGMAEKRGALINQPANA